MTKTASFLASAVALLLAPILPAAPAAAQSCVDPPAGVLAWWPGDGSAQDVIAGLDGMPSAGMSYAPGVVADAFVFDTTDDRVVLPRDALDGLGDLTVEFWLSSSATNTAGVLSAANANVGGDNELFLLQTPTAVLVAVKQVTGSFTASLNDGNWHHVALVREGTLVRLYVDGVSVGERTYPAGPLDVGPRGFVLGEEQDCLGGCFDPNQAFTGMLDELTVYPRALSEAEIASVVAAGSSGKCLPPQAPEDGGLSDRVSLLESTVTDLSSKMDALQAELDALSASQSSSQQGNSSTGFPPHGRDAKSMGHHEGWGH